MKRISICAATVAAFLWSPTAFAGEKIKLPSGPAKATPQVSTAIQDGRTPVTNVDWARRAYRNGYYGGYSPYYAYRPYYGVYTPSYARYYTRPYYGYSYYAPSWYYGGWAPGVTFGVGPYAYGQFGGLYW
jgi:hypothetical protein